MSKPVLYSIEISPPVRAVRLTAEAIGLELDVQSVDLFTGEHLKEPFLKLNPQHTVPTLVDEGESIWDSHAICTYLIEKYASDDSLYPKDLIQRARVDQRLHFDSGVLFPAMRGANMAIFKGGSEVPEDKIADISAAYDLLERFLEVDEYLVGNNLTVADFCCVATVTTMEYHVPIDVDKYPQILAWLERLADLPFFEALNTKVMVDFRNFVDQKKEDNTPAE